MQVQSLGREDPLERAMAISSVFLPGEFHGQRNLADYSHGLTKSWTWLKWLSMHAWYNLCILNILKSYYYYIQHENGGIDTCQLHFAYDIRLGDKKIME